MTPKPNQRSRWRPSGERQSRKDRAGADRGRLPKNAASHLTYIWISTGSGFVTVMLLCLYVWRLPSLISNGVHRQMYYVLLFPLALSVAALCFGVMGSYASYKGSAMSGTLRLSGPIVGIALVVIGGFWLVPSADVFAVTVRLFGPDNTNVREGSITVYLGQDALSAALANNGEASLKEIPPTFRNQKGRASTQTTGYRLADDTSEVTLSDLLILNAIEDSNAVEPIVTGSFSLTARVLDEFGRPVRTGTVTLYLGHDSRKAPIAQNGEANFKGIPFKFNGKLVPTRAEAAGLQMVGPHQTVFLGETVSVQMRPTSVKHRSSAKRSRIIQQGSHAPGDK
jgi:hypothetical protein